jgi:pimeloyl-ACP methyl ester carboxylesterase
MYASPWRRTIYVGRSTFDRAATDFQKGNAMHQNGFVHLTRSFGHGMSRRAVLNRFAGAGALAALAAAKGPTPAFARFAPARAGTAFEGDALMAQTPPTAETAPTVVLVHGAFADAGSWAGVVLALQAAGINVQAPANPLRGVSSDAAYIASVANQTPGPVVLVGHSYGGVVISNAAPQAANVVGLVYVAAFLPDEGETLLSLAEQATDSLIGPALRPTQFPTGDSAAPGTEFYVDPASFTSVVAADLPAEQAAVLAASQRPASDKTFGEPSGPVGWKSLPSWAAISPSDLAIGPSGERFMAERAGAEIVEIDGSHLLIISQAQAVTDLILKAVKAVS